MSTTDLEDALKANADFYAAFTAGDCERVVSLLADRSEITVMHPGWPIVRGRVAVTRTWQDVSAQPPPVQLHDVHACAAGPGVVLVTCIEDVGGTLLAATNVWIADRGGWRLLHHQAGASMVTGGDHHLPDDDLTFH